MRRFFYIVIFLAVCVSFFRSDIAKDMLHGEHVSLSGWFNRISQAAEEKVMAEFREDAKAIFSGLRPHQIEYAQHLMKDRQTLGVFYLRYCQGDDKNPYIFGNTRIEFCEQIRRAGIISNR